MDKDISMDIRVKSVNIDMDGKFHIRGKPGCSVHSDATSTES